MRLQPLAQLVGERQVGDDLLFRNVDDQSAPFVRVGTVGLDDVLDRNHDQRADRDVDRDTQVDAELGKVQPRFQRAGE